MPSEGTLRGVSGSTSDVGAIAVGRDVDRSDILVVPDAAPTAVVYSFFPERRGAGLPYQSFPMMPLSAGVAPVSIVECPTAVTDG